MTSVCVVTPWLDHEELAPDYFGAMVLGNPEQLVIIDNASTPPLSFATVRSETNRGWGGANNDGLATVREDAVLFINNDVFTADRQWLEKFRGALEPGVLVGANLRYDRHGDVDGVSLPYLDGWCIGGMTSDLRELNGFDEEYREPAYYSDNDLCLRARIAGMRLRAVKTGLMHKGSATAPPQTDPFIQALLVDNYTLYATRAREALDHAAA